MLDELFEDLIFVYNIIDAFATKQNHRIKLYSIITKTDLEVL